MMCNKCVWLSHYIAHPEHRNNDLTCAVHRLHAVHVSCDYWKWGDYFVHRDIVRDTTYRLLHKHHVSFSYGDHFVNVSDCYANIVVTNPFLLLGFGEWQTNIAAIKIVVAQNNHQLTHIMRTVTKRCKKKIGKHLYIYCITCCTVVHKMCYVLNDPRSGWNVSFDSPREKHKHKLRQNGLLIDRILWWQLLKPHRISCT